VRALDILHQELDVTMGLCGVRDVRQVDRSILKANPFSHM
jgi:isopentenyl diphosphate isomerase/L-lactate dehydrogenase-like FMN-dependent dehydrogenase